MKDGMPTGPQQLERQKKLGLVPEDAKMVDWPEVHSQMGFLQRGGEKVFGTPDGGQCRFSGTC